MNNKRKVAQPTDTIGAYNSIRSFLGLSLLNDTDKPFTHEYSLSRIEIQELGEKRYSNYSKGKKSNVIDEFIQKEIATANNYLGWFILKFNKDIEYTDSLNGYIKFLENEFKAIAKPSKHELEKLIYYYTRQKYNTVFIELYNSIEVICNWVKPINPAIDNKYYIEYLINKIEFNDIIERENKDAILNNLYIIHFVLIDIFNRDINTIVNGFLNSIKIQTNTELNRIQKEIITVLSQIKQNKSNIEIDIHKEYLGLIKAVQNDRILIDLDYRIFILNISNQIGYLLFNSLTNINDTIKELKPLIETTSTPQQDEIDKTFDNKENHFNNVPINLATKYFMQLAEKPNEYLTKDEVNKFIDKAFCNGKIKKKFTLQLKRGEQQKIWKLFANFYNDCTTDSIYQIAKQGTKEKYVRLITDNFTNWKYETVFDNFTKSTTKYWKRLKDFNK